MNKSSLTFVFISISILTFILGSWQLFRLNWKNDLMDNINNSIINPDLFSNDNKYNNLVSVKLDKNYTCLLYTSPSPRDATLSRMPSSA